MIQSAREVSEEDIDRAIHFQVGWTQNRLYRSIGVSCQDGGCPQIAGRHLLRRSFVEMNQPDGNREGETGLIPLVLSSDRAVRDVAQATVRRAHGFAKDVGEFTDQATIGVVDADELHRGIVVGHANSVPAARVHAC